MSEGVYRVDKILTDALKGVGFKRVTFGQEGEIDLKKGAIFPIAHMTIVNSIHASSVITYNYEITILDLVDSNSNSSRDSLNELSLTTNIEDVFHDLGFMWNKAWQGVKRTVNNQVQLPDTITLNAGYAEVQNKLAGYTISLDITIPSTPIC